MRTRFALLLAILLLALSILSSACGSSTPKSSTYETAYVENEDFNPTFYSELLKPIALTETQDRTYYQVGAFVFFVDADTMDAHPLCYKPECLHNAETDPQKVTECNAFVGFGNSAWTYLASYHEKLYTYALNRTTGRYSFIEMDTDGSDRKTLIDDAETLGIVSMALHRGVLYYVGVYSDGQNGAKQLALYAMPLTGGRKKPVAVYQSHEDAEISELMPFGNDIFFLESIPNQLYEIKRYDIQTGETMSITDDMSFAIAGATRQGILLRNGSDHLFYGVSKDGKLTLDENLHLNRYAKAHGNLHCFAQCIEDDFALVFCSDSETNDLVFDLLALDRNGEVTATIPLQGWNTTASGIVNLNGEAYFITGPMIPAPYMLQAYRKADLLQGNPVPQTLLEAESINSFTPAYTYGN